MVSLSVDTMGVFNYALYENRVSPIRGIKITNHTDRIITGLSLRITTDSGFFKECRMSCPLLPVGKATPMPDPHLMIEGQRLAEVTDAFTINVSVCLLEGDNALDTASGQMKILAYDQWMGDDWVHYLPAFCMPNHPIVTALIHDASDVLKKWGKDCALEGYQTPDPNRIRDFAAAIYTAIQNKNIAYSNPPAGAGVCDVGQRIRTPESTMEQHLATCMDFTMLYASCLEAIGLNPVLCLIKGHIFAGVWLTDKCFDDVCTLDNGIAIKAMATGNQTISFVECTRMQSASKDSYQEAEYKPDHPNFDKDQFEYLIDIRAARHQGIRPIAARYVKNGHFQIDVPERNESEMPAAPSNLDIVIMPQVTTTKLKPITSKVELWENKLLDLSGNNMLLNLPYNSTIEPIMSVRIDGLYSALASGEEFQLSPVPEQILALGVTIEDEKKNKKEMPWLAMALGMCGGPYEMTNWIANPEHDFTGFIRREYQSHRLYSFRAPKEHDRTLTGIYRAAQASQQENGVSSLYMSVGLLRWLDDDHKPHYAPLVLVPIEMTRKAGNRGYSLRARDEDPHFNLTLLEMLRQNHGIEIGGLEPLPANDQGVDMRKVFAIVRTALMEIGHWDVVETCAIGNFSFAQFAMWNDLRQSEALLDKNKLVRSLMQGYMDWDATAQGEPSDDKLYLPISVDDSQLQAIRMANHQQTFVLHGPPGTGKSQTITAMIANLAANGKRVLFVAEKMAALSVVEKRLTAIGLGDFCLELHSDKANKKHVLGQLSRALNRSSIWRTENYDETLAEVERSRTSLDTYSKHLHRIHACGYSVHDLIDRYEQAASSARYIPFSGQEASEMTRERLNRHPFLLDDLIAAGRTVGDVQNHPFKGIALDTYAPTTHRELRELLRVYMGRGNALIEIGKELSERYDVKVPTTPSEFQATRDALSWWHGLTDDIPMIRLCLDANIENVRRMIRLRAVYRKQEEKQQQIWTADFLSGDIQAWIDKIEAARKKLIGSKGATKALFTQIQYCARVPITQDQMATLCRDALSFKSTRADYQKEESAMPEADRALFEALSTETQLDDAAQLLARTRATAEAFPGGFKHALSMAAKPELPQDLEQIESAIADWNAISDRLGTLLCRESVSSGTPISDEMEFAGRLMQGQSYLKDWTHYNHVKKACIEAGLAPVVQAYESGMSPRELPDAYRKGLYYALISLILNHDDVLGTFSGPSFNQTIRQFKQLDDILLKQAQKELVIILNEQAQNVSFDIHLHTEVPFLRKAISSNARGLSIRQLFEKIPRALPRLCPIMLMSPNSVSQYLERKSDLFDVVIFDEASQLPGCKAVGALIRARDAVIVGDPRQMPPTAFFAGGGPVVDDLALDDLDSILDDALALGVPSRYLSWHYRSTHESLIAFSNHEFYENRMFTFPSANDREKHVIRIQVDGTYSKSVNPKEAEAIVAEIIRRYRDPTLRQLSIGVVTFNVKQQDLIFNLLAKQYQKNPGLDAWANNGEDPVFVKNLENVQGDERDVILFSIGYGPDEKGHVSMNFGPINKAGGGKRLNVAFSRARTDMMIFTCLQSSQIKITDTSPEGLIAFRDFLKFVEGGELKQSEAVSQNPHQAQSGICDRICAALESKGYRYQTHVGHSDFQIDIAVIDPYHPDQYLLGIMLDGEQYNRTRNTRDREVSQTNVLARLGWKLTRVWSIDWWDDANRQINRLQEMLKPLKETARIRREEEDARQADEAKDEEEQTRLRAELEQQASEMLKEQEETDASRPIEMPAAVAPTDAMPSGDTQKSDEAATDEADDQTVTPPQTTCPEPESEAPHAEQEESKPEGIEDAQDSPASEMEPPASSTVDAVDSKEDPGTQTSEPSAPVAVLDDARLDVAASKVGATPTIHENMTGNIEVVPYEFASLPQTKMTPAEFASPANRQELIRRVEMLLAAEAPIQKDRLIRLLVASFGVTKSSITVDATEKALKAVKAKNTKLQGNVFCWANGQDPTTYRLVRANSARLSDELPPHEIRNAICLLLQQKGSMSRDSLFFDASRLFGYKKLGKNLQATLASGLAYAKKNGDVLMDGESVRLYEDT